MAEKKKRWLGWTTRIAAVGFVLWVGLLGFVAWAMRQPPEVFGRVMSHMPMPAFFVLPFETLWSSARHGHVEVGDMAPALPVMHLNETTPVDLGSLWVERPVVLVFGSYT